MSLLTLAHPTTPRPATAVAQAVYTAEVVEGLAALDRVEAFHGAHQAHPQSHLDLLRASFLNGRQATPFLVQVAREGQPCLLVVGQVAHRRLEWRIGYRTLHAWRARVIEVLRGGWLGDQSRPCLEFLCAYLCEFLRRGGADAIHVRHVAAGSGAHEVFAQYPSWIWRDRHPAPSTNWRMRVPHSFAVWAQARAKSERQDTKRYDRRIRDQFGESVRVEVFSRVSEVDRAAEVVERIARRTYQRGMGAGFHDSAEARARWRAGAAAGALDVRVLWFADQPVAFSSGFVLDRTLWGEHLGYDPAFRRFRPGMFLILRVIAALACRGDVRTIDFGIGDADYKRRLGDQSRETVSIYLFAPTLRGLWLNGLRGAATGLGRVGQACLARLGLLSGFKRRWRRALQPKDADSTDSGTSNRTASRRAGDGGGRSG